MANFYFSDDYPVRKIPVRTRHSTNGHKSATRQVEQSSVAEPKRVQEAEVKESPPVETHQPDHQAPEADWKMKAIRLQAEMENFRKRQERRANEAIAAERERLLSLILPVADNLTRALIQQNQPGESLRQGVELTHRELMRTLEAEGVTRLETVGKPFDPTLHEAVAAIPSETAESDMIIEEIEAGYILGDKLLRPAKVVVAA